MLKNLKYGQLVVNYCADGRFMLTYGCTILGWFNDLNSATSAFTRKKWQLRGE